MADDPQLARPFRPLLGINHLHARGSVIHFEGGAQNRDRARRRRVLPVGLILEIQQAVALPCAFVGDRQDEEAVLPISDDVATAGGGWKTW